MLDILQFYVSGFWVWLGLTIGLSLVVKMIALLVLGLAGVIRGGNITIE
ncbi:hypothetical protein [Salipiger sp. PrR003]|nr:hypothetical protein [Salipiger sp. PrR003]NDV53852.1 hypothetical protein [Salipiger sp. PrR003]